MKKNGLTSAVIAGIAGVAGFGSIADAVNLNPDGLGQVLIYPYYTTRAGNDTLISVVNTSDTAKAVKVRFLEGRNSREVLDFHLYLSAYDVWTGGIVKIPGEDGAGVYTTDNSCTVPQINGNPELPVFGGVSIAPFVEYAYADLDHTPAAPHLGSIERTREGYIEIIEMANIIGTAAAWVTHNASGVPANCAAARAAWLGGGWPPGGEAAPSGQGELFGNAMIVNAARGTIAGYAADAIEGFNYTSLHFPPGDIEPNLNHVNDMGTTAQATAYVFEFGNLITSTYVDAGDFEKVDAISALYATPRVINEYYLDGNDTVRGSTEWVITFPTKRFYVDDNDYIIDSSGTIGVYSPNAPLPPFSNPFRNNGSCENIRVRVYDREEATPQGGGLFFSPPRPGTPQNALCWEAQVVTFGQGENVTAGNPSDILGSTYFQNINPPFEAGWASLEFGTQSGGSFNVPELRPSDEGNVFRGLPVTGFFATNYDNGVNDSGVLANYTALFRHRTVRDCVNGGDVCS